MSSTTSRTEDAIGADGARTAGAGRRGTTGLAVAAVVGLAVLGGCGAPSSDGRQAPPQTSPSATSAPADAGVASRSTAGAGGTSGSSRPQQVAPVDRRLVRQATMSMEVDDVARASSEIAGVADDLGGWVDEENLGSSTSGDRDPSTWGRVTIKVPTDKHADAMRRIEGKGRLLSRSSSVEDVTAQYVDTRARVRTMKLGIERIQRLLAKADTLDDVIALESELSTREGELESMQSQLKSLEDTTSTSTISVELTTDADLATDDDTGFVAGLRKGWGAFAWSVTAILTVLGAVLPFVLALALLLAPLVWWLRRRSRRARTASAPGRLVDQGHDPRQDVGVGARQHPVPQVEDVAGRRPPLREDRPDA